MSRKGLVLFFLVLCGLWLMASGNASSFVVREGGRTYIVDQKGERWDVTQAESIGFDPDGFQYGIGRDAFTPLDGSQLSDDRTSVRRNLRVIGVAEGSEAHAYSVPRLTWHEIANTEIDGKPIAVGY